MSTEDSRRTPDPAPSTTARDLLELAVGAQQVYQEAETHLAQVVKAAVGAGATWEHVASWLDTMTAEEARGRFEHADAVVYLDEPTVILLGAFAHRRGIRSLREAVTVVLEGAARQLKERTPAADDVAAQDTPPNPEG